MSEVDEIGEGAARRLAGFARTLRENGFAAGLAETRDALAILASAAGRRTSALRPALRALFSSRRTDWQRFDAIFDAHWLGRGVRARTVAGARPPGRAAPAALDASSESGGAPGRGGDGEGKDGATGRDLASSVEVLASKDLRHIVEPTDTARIHALAERLARRMRARLLRRDEARRRGRGLDLRRTIHRSIPFGGTPLALVHRRRKVRPLRLVLLLDASGSMSLYTAFFIRFVHALVDAFREAEAFVFHTRLVHVSQALRERDARRAVDRLSLMAQGIGGGTRIGDSLADFNRWHAARVVNGRTAVLILSDGYDTGEPERLDAEMARLRRRCRRIVWLNPLIGWRDYAPSARGMQAALPHVDLFAPAHTLESLAALEPYLARI